MSRLLPALALLAVSAAAAADKDPWLRLASPHFEIFTDAGERAGRDVDRLFEQVHSFFFRRFRTGIDPNRKARVLLFRNEREYELYRPNQFSAAFYHAGEYHDFIVMNNSGSQWRTTAVHELTHLMVRQLGQDLPLWLNEGLAELYSNMEPRGAQVMVGRDLPGRMNALAGQPWIELRTLLEATQESPAYKARTSMFYAESWKLVHMLHLQPAYEAHLTDLIRALAGGDAPAAFQTAYGKDLAGVEHDLRSYLGGDTITALLFDIQLPKSIDAPEIEAGASLFARLAVAELLSNMRGRSAAASEAYLGIARDFPGRWEVEEAQGRFAWRERNVEDAARHFSRAAELGCRQGDMYLLWGRVLGYGNRARDAVPVLARAVELLPDSAEAQLAWGDALIRNQDWAGGVAALRAVKNVPAAAMWRYCYSLAFGLYRLGDLDGAKPLLAGARKYSANQRETTSLDQLEASLNLLDTLEGTLERMECGQPARLHVRTGDTVRVFLMPDPRVLGAAELPCGAQPGSPRLRMQYQPLPAPTDAAGLVRTLEFQ